MKEIRIGENEENQRIDKFLRKYMPNAPLSYLYRMIRKKDIKLNGKRTSNDATLKKDDIIALYIKDDDLDRFTKKKKMVKAKRQFKIVYEDSNILVAEKPKGLLVHGTAEEKKNTLVNQVCTYLQQKDHYSPDKEKTFVPAAVNRLDRNTSGLVIFGKNNKALQLLNQMIRDKQMIKKYYLTIVSGEMKKPLHIKKSLIKDSAANRVRVSNEKSADAKESETIFKPILSNRKYTLVEAELITGRTHQIRAHLKEAGFPLLGDEKYGNVEINGLVKRQFGLSTQFLHAYKLKFTQGVEILSYLEGKEIVSELPPKLKLIKEKLFNKTGDEK